MPGKTSKRKARAVRKRKSDFEQRMEDFGEEMEALGKRLEKRGDNWDSWFRETFGVVGPFISSIFGLLVLVLIVLAMGFINLPIRSMLLLGITSFLVDNMGWFFLIFLFFSYTSYFSRTCPRVYRHFSPIVSAAGITIGLWLIARAISIVNIYAGSLSLSRLSFLIDMNLSLIFWFILILGYLILLLKLSCSIGKKERIVMRKAARGRDKIRRLYRSGTDKILGGVCGGIGEYLGVDPVVIRLLWIIGTFAFGFGILAYIIAWIIIPRNPRHRWR